MSCCKTYRPSSGPRRLYLQNAAGVRYDLNGKDGVWATDPAGLGVDLSPTYGDLGQGFFTTLEDYSEPQASVGFTVIFTDRAMAYTQYQDLTRWIAAAGGSLLLVYDPCGVGEYYRRVSLSYLRKTEKTQLGWLEIPAEFKCLTPWYQSATVDVSMQPRNEAALRYAFRYDRARFDTSRADVYSVLLQAAGDVPAAVELSFTGEVLNPVLTLVGASSGTLYGRCAIATTLSGRDRLEYSSAYFDSYCRKISGKEITDLDDYINPASEPFFRIPPSEACILRLTGQTIKGDATARLYTHYRTV